MLRLKPAALTTFTSILIFLGCLLATPSRASRASRASSFNLPAPRENHVNNFAQIITPQDARVIRKELRDLEELEGIEGTVVTLEEVSLPPHVHPVDFHGAVIGVLALDVSNPDWRKCRRIPRVTEVITTEAKVSPLESPRKFRLAILRRTNGGRAKVSVLAPPESHVIEKGRLVSGL